MKCRLFSFGKQSPLFYCLLGAAARTEPCSLPATCHYVARKTLDTPCVHTCLGYFFLWPQDLRWGSANISVLLLCSHFKALAWSDKTPQHHQLVGLESASSPPASPWAGRWTTLEGKGKATHPRSFGSTLAVLDGTQHPHPADRPLSLLVGRCSAWLTTAALLHPLCQQVVPSVACLQGRFHDGPGFVKASFLVSSLWLCKSEFCPNLVFLAKIPQLTHEPISDKFQQLAVGAQTGVGGCTMAADLVLMRCVVWGLLTQNSHG